MLRSVALAFAVSLGLTLGCARETQRAAPAASTSGPEPTPSALPQADAAARGREACRVKFTGAEDSQFTGAWWPGRGGDKVMAATDYWATPAEMRSALRAGMKEKDPAEAEHKIDARMERDPRLVVLELHCVTSSGALVIVSSEASKYADIPFKPGNYKLGTGTVESAPAGDFAVVRIRSATTPYIDVKPGTLTLTRFDGTGVAGSFSFSATSTSTKAPAKIEGTFALPCEPNHFGLCQLGG